MANFNDIKNKWTQAAKVRGCEYAITLQDGRILGGSWVLCNSGACTPSHDALNGFAPSAGFPLDDNGGSVNDRDYFRDSDAQQVTREIARNYDARAIQNAVIVSPDGVVLSGNGRTMAGELAARNNTDGAYIDYLRTYYSQYGLTQAQIYRFTHPRLLFVLNDSLPYTVGTFAMFNARDMKSQSKTEAAVKYGRMIDDSTFARMLSVINAFETLGEFYANTEAATRCLDELLKCGIVDRMGYAELFDGDTISAQGREMLENVLIGKAFVIDTDAARKITSYKSLRKSVVFALSEVANNLTMGEDYTLQGEIAEAVNLAYVARQHGYKAGERVSGYARQLDAFSGETVCDVNNTPVLTIADAINAEQVTLFKRIMAVYNSQAQDAAAGQTDMFSAGGIKTKADILGEIKDIFATSTQQEQKAMEKTAIQARTAQNVFVPEELSTNIAKGAYVSFLTFSGEAIVCMVEDVSGGLVSLIAKGGCKFTAYRKDVSPTADHNLSLPEWLQVGKVLTDGKTTIQRIMDIQDGYVYFEWVNGGMFDISIATALKGWRECETTECGIIEAA